MEVKFRKSVGGFKPQDVMNYLHQSKEKQQNEVILLQKENEDLKKELAELKAQLAEALAEESKKLQSLADSLN